MPAKLTMEVRRASERRDLALELMPVSDGEVPRIELPAQLDDDPIELAQRIRKLLGISDATQKAWGRDPRTHMNAWRRALEDAGVLVFQTDSFPADVASGFALAYDVLPVIGVNRKGIPPTRRTFSMLHELVHILLRLTSVSDEVGSDDDRPPEDQKVEVFCNQVAAEIIFPRTLLVSRPEVSRRAEFSTDWDDSEISSMADAFGVSREMVVRRLLTYRYTTVQFYRTRRDQYNEEFRNAEERKRATNRGKPIPRDMPRETVGSIGKPLVRAVLDNYRSDRITLSDVSGMLGVKAKHIPKIEQLTRAE
jgi:Zn-dependent peptidase ImmA (M78 family)